MSRNYFITGGAGFIGSNYVCRLLERGEAVTIYDNLSRAGAPLNLTWLNERFGSNAFRTVIGDVRNAGLLADSARDADVIIHLAGQVAVTASVESPRDDFEINAVGTFNLLEAARLSGRNPVFLYASANKVYGSLQDVPVVERATRWAYAALSFGVPESQPLDFHTPYGCSKGAGDQYVRDYGRLYGLRTAVLRQSCIYGPRQFGVEDQGWVAWFVIAAVTGRPLTVYGDGRQVRDLLQVDDLCDAYDRAVENIETIRGDVLNLGGGPANTMSVWAEFGPRLENMLGRSLTVTYRPWRPGDQKVFIADIRKAEKVLGWRPRRDIAAGLQNLFDWVSENKHFF